MASKYKGEHYLRPIWRAMVARCYRPQTKSYKNYGGRGIKVCGRWLNPINGFDNFILDMGDRPFDGAEIDRVNNDGDYEPSNCRWVSHKENSLNRRSTVFLQYNEGLVSLYELAYAIGMNPKTLRARVIDYGWSLDRAINEPVNTAKRNRRAI